jgi:hypothetical protein
LTAPSLTHYLPTQRTKKKTATLHRNLEGTFPDLNERLPKFISRSSPYSSSDYLHLKAFNAFLIVSKISVHTSSDQWIQSKEGKDKCELSQELKCRGHARDKFWEM